MPANPVSQRPPITPSRGASGAAASPGEDATSLVRLQIDSCCGFAKDPGARGGPEIIESRFARVIASISGIEDLPTRLERFLDLIRATDRLIAPGASSDATMALIRAVYANHLQPAILAIPAQAGGELHARNALIRVLEWPLKQLGLQPMPVPVDALDGSSSSSSSPAVRMEPPLTQRTGRSVGPPLVSLPAEIEKGLLEMLGPKQAELLQVSKATAAMVTPQARAVIAAGAAQRQAVVRRYQQYLGERAKFVARTAPQPPGFVPREGTGRVMGTLRKGLAVLPSIQKKRDAHSMNRYEADASATRQIVDFNAWEKMLIPAMDPIVDDRLAHGYNDAARDLLAASEIVAKISEPAKMRAAWDTIRPLVTREAIGLDPAPVLNELEAAINKHPLEFRETVQEMCSERRRQLREEIARL
ncbi:MAG: hypothetical protein V4669_19115 [Pseudomonadota bacterium]